MEAGLLPEMLLSMQEGGVKEQEMAAQLTWTLCFSDSAKEKVSNTIIFYSWAIHDEADSLRSNN